MPLFILSLRVGGLIDVCLYCERDGERGRGRRLSKPSLNFYCRAKIDVLIGRQTSRAHRCDTPTVTSRKVVLLLPSAREGCYWMIARINQLHCIYLRSWQFRTSVVIEQISIFALPMIQSYALGEVVACSRGRRLARARVGLEGARPRTTTLIYFLGKQ